MNDLLLAEAILGKDAEEFISSELGRFILGRCDQEIQEAQDLLAVVSPWRRNRIRQLQNQVWRAKSLRSWLIELINSGRMAEQALEDQ
jgi:hypothetical protein